MPGETSVEGGKALLAATVRRSQILLVKENQAERERLRSWLVNSGYEVYTAASGTEALGLLHQLPIEVVVTHLRLPGLSGIELLSRIKGIDPQIEVIILSESCTVEDTLGALRGRAFDFLQTPLDNLRQLNQVVSEALLNRCLGGRRPATVSRQDAPSLGGLTPREEQIVSLLALGWENKRIAATLGLGEKTVRNVLSGIYAKLGVTNRTQAVVLYQQRGAAIYPFGLHAESPEGPVAGEAS